MTSQDHVLFVGSGSMPITAFTIAKETGAEITCVDIDKKALDLSKKVTIKLGFPNIIFENELHPKSWTQDWRCSSIIPLFLLYIS